MDASGERHVSIGRVGGAHGVRGWLKIRSATAPPSRIFEYQPWRVHQDGHWHSIEVRGVRRHGESFVVKLDGVDDRESARAWIGADITVRRDQLPPLSPGEYYWCDLIGMTVHNTAGVSLGRVRSLMETGANDVMIVVGDFEILIPFVPEQVVHSVDLRRGKIMVDWQPAV